jgi:hypothetical protein
MMAPAPGSRRLTPRTRRRLWPHGRGLIAEAAAGSAAPGPDTLADGRQVTGLLLHVYAMRMAAVFTMSAATITLRTQVVPRWIGMLGFAVAVVLLVSVGLTVWVELSARRRVTASSGRSAA